MASTDVDSASQIIEKIKLVCPKCESQSLYDINASQSAYNFQCPECHSDFASRVFKVRAKKSQGRKKENKRNFSVRVYDFSGSENLIEFENANYQDFELRAKDLVAFSYLENKLKIVQNFTLSRYMKVSTSSCFLATYLYGPDSEEVAILRRFRDEVLLGSFFFSNLVTLYYYTSPIAIKWLGNNRLFKALSLALIEPIVWGVSRYFFMNRKT